jgi:hypothetical protein
MPAPNSRWYESWFLMSRMDGSGMNVGWEWYHPTTCMLEFWMTVRTSNSLSASISTFCDVVASPLFTARHGNAARTKIDSFASSQYLKGIQ